MDQSTIDRITAQLEESLAAIRRLGPGSAAPVLLPMDARFNLPLPQRPADLLAQVIDPYTAKDEHGVDRFVYPFWMKGLIAAMPGVSVADYNRVNMGSLLGFNRPRHLVVLVRADVHADVDADVVDEHVMTSSPGTPSIGWMPEGANYQFSTLRRPLGEANTAEWLRVGAPMVNAHGDWSQGGWPIEYYRWTHEGYADRGPSPLYSGRWGPYPSGSRQREK